MPHTVEKYDITILQKNIVCSKNLGRIFARNAGMYVFMYEPAWYHAPQDHNVSAKAPFPPDVMTTSSNMIGTSLSEPS